MFEFLTSLLSFAAGLSLQLPTRGPAYIYDRVELSYRQSLASSQGREANLAIGRQREAVLRNLLQVAAESPERWPCPKDHLALALAHEATGDQVAARELCDPLLEEAPDWAVAARLGVRLRLGLDQADAAEALLAASWERLGPRSPLLPYWGALGMLHANRGRHRQAIPILLRFLTQRVSAWQPEQQWQSGIPELLHLVHAECLALGDWQAYQAGLGQVADALSQRCPAETSSPTALLRTRTEALRVAGRLEAPEFDRRLRADWSELLFTLAQEPNQATSQTELATALLRWEHTLQLSADRWPPGMDTALRQARLTTEQSIEGTAQRSLLLQSLSRLASKSTKGQAHEVGWLHPANRPSKPSSQAVIVCRVPAEMRDSCLRLRGEQPYLRECELEFRDSLPGQAPAIYLFDAKGSPLLARSGADPLAWLDLPWALQGQGLQPVQGD